MHMVLAIDHDGNGYLAIGYSSKGDCPRLGWFDLNGKLVHIAGKGYLTKEPSVWAKAKPIVDAWLKDGQKDSLRATGDVRYRVVSRAQVIMS